MQLTLPQPTTRPLRIECGTGLADRAVRLLVFILVSSALIAGYQTRSYWGTILELRELGLSWSDQALMFWSVWAMSLILLAPVAAVVPLVARFPRAVTAIAVGSTLATPMHNKRLPKVP